MPAFQGTLNANDIFAGLFNMIISQQVFADNIGKHQTLVEKAKVDGSLYGDTKIYYSTDVLKSNKWTNDAEAANLLALHRPPAPQQQAIVLNIFRQIRLTVDNYLSKRAWATEGAFADFNGVMLGWIGETKRVYEGATYNAFIGTAFTNVGAQSDTVTLSGTKDGETIAEKIANLLVDMGDYNRVYNDYGHLRSYAEDDVMVIWNAKYLNKIKKVDTPTIFHNEGLVDKLNGPVLPARYFGTVITNTNKDTYADNTPAAGKPLDKDGGYAYTPGANHANGIVRTMVECEVKVSNTDYHLFPGDEIPTGTKLATTTAAGTLLFGEVYIEDAKVICKVVTKLPPFMGAFSVATSFFNPRALTETHYLTWGHNTLEYLKNYPMVTLKQA